MPPNPKVRNISHGQHFLFCVLQTKTLNKCQVLSNIHCHTEFQDHGVSLALTSHVRMAAMFLLLLVGDQKI